jgi:hypothetical protein
MTLPDKIQMATVEDSRAKALRSDSARISGDGFGVPAKQSLREIRDGETPSPAREPRALPEK